MRKLKLLFLSLLILLVLVLNISCFFKEMFEVKVQEMDGVVHLECDNQILEYFPYEEIPSFDFTFEGKVNITVNRQGEYECIFTKNDDFFVSKIIKELIDYYKGLDENRVYSYILSKDKTSETWLNLRDDGKDEKVYIKVLNEEIYNEYTYILLDNGLILSISYARFVDENNQTYYKWMNTESIRMVLHYPFMITTDTEKVPNKNGSNKSFVLLALPLGVTYSFDLTTKQLDRLLSDDKFLEDTYYSYRYLNDRETDETNFKDYYIKYYNGKTVNDEFIFTYLGYDFKVTFNDEYFVINLI